MEDHCCHHLPNKKTSWRRTLVTQVALCIALFAALNIGRRQAPRFPATEGRIRGESLDLYFLSVRGGSWPLKQQTQLLQQMEKAVKIYRAKFVVNIGKLGEHDPLMQNATLHFPLLKTQWYTTSTSHGHMALNFLKKIKIPHEQFLDIIGLDTGSFQDIIHGEQLNESGRDQLSWMRRTLSVTESNWRIVVGFDPLIVCGENNAEKTVEVYEPVHNIFMNYGVNAYLSQLSCAGHYYHDGGIAYLGNPTTLGKRSTSSLLYGNPDVINENMSNGFLLHRVSPLEIESYFIDLTGKVVSKYVIHQRGRGVM